MKGSSQPFTRVKEKLMQSINGNRHDLDQGTNRGSRHWITTLPASLLTLLLVILMAFGPNLRPADAQSAGPTPTPTVDPTPTPPVDPTPTPTPTPGSQIIVGDITIGGTITIITGNLTLDQGTLPPIAGTIGGCAVYALTLANGSTAYPLVDSSCVPNGTTFVPVGGSDGGGIIIESCSPTSTRVVQDCELVLAGAHSVLQDPAIDSLIKLHELPPADEARLLNWERSMVRATMFDRLLAIIALAPTARTRAEQAVVDAFAARLKQQRLAAATFARSEYYRWASNPCMYVPPAPFTYNRPTCSQLGNLFGTGSPPSFEEFQSYGVNEVYKKFSNDATLQRVAGETARDVGVLAGFVATGIAAAVGYTVGASLLAGGTIMAAIHPWLVASLATAAGVTKASLISTGVAAGVTGATSIAAVAAVVVLAVVIGVVQGIAVVNAAAIPGKLDAAVTVAQATPDLKQVISTDAGKQELFALFVAATMPDYAPTGSVPAAEVGDPQFWVTPASGSPSVSTEILYDDWKGNDRRVRMSGGWFVDILGGTSELTLSIDYIDWNGNGWTAARTGDTFLHTRTGGTVGVASFLSAEIKYQTPDGQNYTALLVYPNIAPSFTKGANVTVNEDSGAYSATWGTSISAGPVRESAQTVSFTVANDNSALFSQQPAVSSGGTLSFTPATNANGSATVSVTAKDSGGTAHGGDDTSDTHTFTLTINAVNDAPAFTAGPNVTVAEDSGASSTAWATAISAGPADESGQRLDFLVSTDNAALFSAQPLLGTDGMLSFTPATNANGSATVSVTAKDRGGTAHGGDDTSDAQTFTLTVNAVNDAPAVPANAPTISVVEDTPRSFVLGADLGVNDTADTSGPVAAGAANFPPVASLATVTAPDNGGLSYATTTGTLTFTPTADANGADSFRYRVCDQGTPASACTEQTVNVSITSVNDAPSFTKGADQIVVLNAGAQSVSGWATAISAGPANESAQALSFTLTNDNSALFSQQPALAPNGTLTFTPAAGTVGSALVTVVQKDDGGTALGGNDTSAPQTFRITVRYNVGDFAPPVDLPPTINTVTAGRTIPIKWRLTDASGAPVTGLSSVTITAPVVSGSTGSATDEIEVYVDGSAGLKNLGDGNYQYNWSVPKSYAGSVRMLLLDLGEGPAVEHPALFQFK